MKKNSFPCYRCVCAALFRLGIIRIVAVFAILLIFPNHLQAQDKKFLHSQAAYAEKIYLQLDGNVYTTGNIVWFKCLVASAYNHIPSALSGVLYVELVGENEVVHEKKLIKLENGIGQGYFYLDKTLPEGLYLVRAYTEWDRNFENDFFFNEYIHVFTSEKDIKNPICDVSLEHFADGKKHLKACFLPTEIDSLQKNKLTVYVTIDQKKDSLILKKDKSDAYWMDYKLEDESQFATLQMQTNRGERFSKTIILYNDYLDLQFFPESGELAHGIKSKVGFKALDANGTGKFVEGDIIDEKDSIITSFKSNPLGMGSFTLPKVDHTKSYFARLKFQPNPTEIQLFPLPKVASKGNVLSIERQGENILFSAQSNYLKDDTISLNISFRGVTFYEMKLGLKNGIARLLLAKSKLPEGIIAVTMTDTSMQPVAERLYFNERPDFRAIIKLSTDKSIYQKRELTSLSITALDVAGEPLQANLSVLVINKKQMGEVPNSRQNLLSYFLLDSELKGEIESPGFYFQRDSDRFMDLDALMLTQGWRKYNYLKPYDKPIFEPERNLSVSGQVSSLLSKKKKKQAVMTMMTFGENKGIYTQTADNGAVQFYHGRRIWEKY